MLQLNEALDSARTEVSRLHRERDCYEQTMKKAFMRGVCALNLEAMSMFQHGDAEGKLNVLDQLCFHRIHTVVSSQLIIMAEMAVFYVAGYLIEERRRWTVITASPRGQRSK